MYVVLISNYFKSSPFDFRRVTVSNPRRGMCPHYLTKWNSACARKHYYLQRKLLIPETNSQIPQALGNFDGSL